MEMRAIWFGVCGAVFIIGLLFLTTITLSTWQTLTLWQAYSVFFQFVTGWFCVLSAYWLYNDKKDMEELKEK
jgi:hypothetical protein